LTKLYRASFSGKAVRRVRRTDYDGQTIVAGSKVSHFSGESHVFALFCGSFTSMRLFGSPDE
jgi:hypothetical protein